VGETTGVIIVAAGAGTRMDGLDKLFAMVAGRPLLAHAVAAFEECWSIQKIVVVLSEANYERGRSMLEEQEFAKIAGVCTGGARRQDSVYCGLQTLGEVDWVAVHDGGRPLVRPGMIARGLDAARETGASVPVITPVDTIKEIDADDRVVRTLDRTYLRRAQTPQCFRYDLLLRAHREVTEDVTDDAAMMETLGVPVKTYEGRRRNIKITTPEDLALAEAWLH
jgi:2-C-methyl-D-erythritol 4-phosphate cytidylyltransferase